MTMDDLIHLLPFTILAVGVLSTMLSIAFYRHSLLAAGFFLTCIVSAFASLFVGSTIRYIVGDLIVIDQYSRYFTGLIVLSSGVVGLLFMMHRSSDKTVPEEFYCLLLLATLGAITLASSCHAATLLLGLEMLSISLYSMIAYVRTKPSALEAAVKYLIMASTSSAFLIFGLALLYAATGSLDVARWIVAPAGESAYFSPSLLAIGGVLVIIGASFKLAVFPLHMWTPDVYQASTEPVAAFIATASKSAMIAFLLRFATSTGSFVEGGMLVSVVSVVAVLSMLAGNLLALLQDDLRRLLAYSSIAHMGYLLVGIIASGVSGSSGTIATGYYLATYFPVMLAIFGVLSMLKQMGRHVSTLEDLRGLARERPFASAVLILSFLSLAGLPLTSGFMGKLYIVTSGVEGSDWSLVIALVIGTAIGIYYYLRVISAIFASPASTSEVVTIPVITKDSSWIGTTILIAILAMFIIWLGVQPLPVLKLLTASNPIAPQTAVFYVNPSSLAP